MKMELAFLAFLAVLALANSAQALQLSDNIFFTVPADSIECINVYLPDDSGYRGSGNVEYTLTCEPGPSRSWGDLTEQIVWTDENNTVLIPICFSTFGRQEGNCSDTFTIGISAPDVGMDKIFQGGVCVSQYRGVDTNPPQPGQDPGDVISDNVDIFAMGFRNPSQYASPGQRVVYKLALESYADVTMDLSVQTTELSVSPAQDTVSLSSSEPLKQINYTVQAPGQPGSYNFNVTGTIRGCSSGFCSRQARGELVVSDAIPRQTGFSVSIFPESINVKELEPVSYHFTIYNRESERTFKVEMDVPEGIQTSFQPQNVTVGADVDRTITFTVTPSNVSSFYEIRLSAISENMTKQATAYLSTNEMLTDATRAAGWITDSTTNQSLINDVDSALDDWYNNQYRDSGYGENLEGYGSLQDTLNNARAQIGEGAAVDNQTQDQTDQQDQVVEEGLDLLGKDLWILVVVIVIVVAALLVIAYKRTKPVEDYY